MFYPLVHIGCGNKLVQFTSTSANAKVFFFQYSQPFFSSYTGNQPVGQEARREVHSPARASTPSTRGTASVGDDTDFCPTPPVVQTPPTQATAAFEEEEFSLNLFDVEHRFSSNPPSDSEMDAGGGDDVQQFIDAIPDAVCAVGGEGVVPGVQQMLGTDNAASIDGQAAIIRALIERMSSLESTVRANSQHDENVLNSKGQKVDELKALNLQLFRLNTQIELLKDAVVCAEKERRKDLLAAEKQRQVEEKERQRVAKHHRAGRRADSRRVGRIREALVALTKQTEDSGDKVADTIAEQTSVMRQLQLPTKLHTIPEPSQASASPPKPAAARTPAEPLRRGLRLQRGGMQRGAMQRGGH